MFDIKWIRENSREFDTGLAWRNLEPLSSRLIELDDRRCSHVVGLQKDQSLRNVNSRKIGEARANGDDAMANEIIAETGELKEKIRQGEERERELTASLTEALSSIPNLPLSDVPQGDGEMDNLEIRVIGEKKYFSFRPKEHFEIAEKLASVNRLLGQMDFECAAKLAGSRFVVLSQSVARLERALGQFMLDLHTTRHGYVEVSSPLLVRDEVVYGTGQLPKFSADLFHTESGHWLVPTTECPLTNIVSNKMLDHNQLPVRFASLAPCFRSEAGAAGRDTRGMLRQHQFYKVELVSITDKCSSADELERMLDCAEETLRQLGLHYRVVVLCTGDLGFSARKTYDIEVWLPGQNTYREVSSCSVCGDFQARRMNARYRHGEERKPDYVHTLNGSGVAVGRALIAVLENYQNEDGSVDIPEVLWPYMDGMKKIESL